MNKLAKNKITIVGAIFVLATLGLFQNCGKSSDSLDQQQISASGDLTTFEKDEEIEAVVGEEVDLEVPELSYLEFLNDGECLWTYTDTKGVTKTIKNPKRIFKLGKVSKKQAGTYRLACANSRKEHTYNFQVAVADPIAPPDAIGHYEGSYIVAGKAVAFVAIDNVTYLAAIADCKKNYAAHTDRGIRCLWQKVVILSKAEPVALLQIFTTVNAKETKNSEVKNLTKPAALVKCNDMVKKNPTLGVRCLWGTVKLLTVAEPVKKDTLQIFTTSLGKEVKNSEVKNLVQATALTQCKAFADKNKTLGVRCMWGATKIFTQVEPPNPNRKDTLKGYMTKGKGAKEQFYKSVGGLTRAQALTTCKSEAAKGLRQFARLGVRCTWGSEQIYKLDAK